MSTTQVIHRALNAYAPSQTWNTGTHRQTHASPSQDQTALMDSGDADTEAPLAQPYPTHEQIAQCAYGIYVSHGRTEGRSEQDWHQAEEQLTGLPEASSPDTAARILA